MSLRPPPRKEAPSRVLARLIVLALLLALVGVLVWSAVINQRIPLVEDLSITQTAEGGEFHEGLYVVSRGSAATPVVLLHDFDVSGSLLLAGLAEELGDPVRSLRIDLPGFGFSARIPESGEAHTVSGMAATVASYLSEEEEVEAIVVGVGLGGRVAAEIAATRPELVGGLILVDVDFLARAGWLERLQALPLIGPALIHAFEGAGAYGVRNWAPECDTGGWCPTPEQVAERAVRASIAGTTDSLYAFRATRPASVVPARLDEITVPTVYVWSTGGNVPRISVDEVIDRVPAAELVEVAVDSAVVEAASSIADVVRGMLP